MQIACFSAIQDCFSDGYQDLIPRPESLGNTSIHKRLKRLPVRKIHPFHKDTSTVGSDY
jgi:hypothetical protein